MEDDKIALKTNREQAIELFATNPDIQVKKVAELIGVHRNTIIAMRQDPNFHEQVLTRFNLELEGKLPNMLKALERECSAGNINGMKLMLEYLNKLQKNVSVVVLSPFEKWLKEKDLKGELNNIEDAEIVSDESEFDDLPERTTKNNHMEVHRERVKLKNLPKKARSMDNRNTVRRERYKWLKRAKAVGIDKLPSRRPTAGQKKAWDDKVVAAEKKASKSQQE